MAIRKACQHHLSSAGDPNSGGSLAEVEWGWGKRSATQRSAAASRPCPVKSGLEERGSLETRPAEGIIAPLNRRRTPAGTLQTCPWRVVRIPASVVAITVRGKGES